MTTWALSVVDQRAHAVDETAEHPRGVLVAQCGEHVSPPLREEPHGRVCQSCAAQQYDDASPGLAQRITDALHTPEAYLQRLADAVAHRAGKEH